MKPMDFEKTYNRYLNAPEKKEIDFSSATIKEKIAALELAGATVNPKRAYNISRVIRRKDDESAKDFAARVMKLDSCKPSDVNAAWAGTVTEICGFVKVKGSSIVDNYRQDKGYSDYLTALQADEAVNCTDSKVTIENLGGENFKDFIAYAAGRLGLIK